MKTNLRGIASVVLFFVSVSLFTSAKPTADGGYDWLKPRLDGTKAFTIEVLEAMPEDKYDFRPNDDQRTFAAQAYHIIYSVAYFHKAFSTGSNVPWSPGDEESKSKDELINWANEAFDTMNDFILSQDNNDQLTAGIIYFLDHNSHHRGQIITYLRMKGITPPNYR